MLSFITGALGFLGRLPGGALNLIDRRRQWATADRVEIDDSFTAEIASLKEELAEAEGDDERLALKEAIKRARQEQRSFHRARRELLLSKSLVQRMTPTGAITAGEPPLPQADREILEAAAAVVARLEPPKTSDDHVLQGNAFYAAGDYDRALEEYNRALELRPDDPDTLSNRGVTLRHLQRYDEALVAYNRSLELRPDDPGTLNNRGVTLHILQRYDEALVDFNRSLEFRPDHPNTLYNRAGTYSHLHRASESLNGLREAISRDAEYREAARADEDHDFDNLRSDPTLGPVFERLVA